MQKIHARATVVQALDAQTAFDFVTKHHRDSMPRLGGSSTSLGLYFKEELVAVAIFCQPRTDGKQKKYSVELLRLAFRKSYRVRGGASKLVSYYRKEYNPPDIFTYQDMRGEATSVYEHCGFTLVSQAKKKDYLVAPGQTLKTATRSEALGMAYATRYGPDRITGSKLGEILRHNGSRKPNRELFLEDLGWHVESTPGDRVYEWIDPNRTYYTYRITASDSDKYYYGVSHVKKANASLELCQAHHYMGSGGAGKQNKFQNWKRRHGGKLAKEALQIYPTQGEAYAAEEILVGALYATDPLCLNATTGGKGGGLRRDRLHESFTIQECAVHGTGNFKGSHCCRCVAARQIQVLDCAVHGLTKHRGGTCYRCSVRKQFSLNDCIFHGVTLHRSDVCCRCSTEKVSSREHCALHGKVSHRFGHCLTCQNNSSISKQECSFHGLSTFRGSSCLACLNGSINTVLECGLHGPVVHQGLTCSVCTSEKSITVKLCPVHGQVAHRGLSCATCVSQGSIYVKICSTHGETTHQGDSCSRCNAESSYSMRVCGLHGSTAHQGEQCKKCEAKAVTSLKECPTHGLTKHKKTCAKCSAVSTLRQCQIHGLVKHRGLSCYSCRAARTADAKQEARAGKPKRE